MPSDSAAAKITLQKYKIKAAITGKTTADLSGKEKDLIKYLTDIHGLDMDEVEEFYPHLFK